MKKMLLVLSVLCGFIATAQEVTTVEFTGTKKTKVSFLKHLVQVQSGQKIDSALLENDVQKLKRLAGIANATYRIDGDKVVYDITENFTLIPAVNIWSVDDIFSYKAGLYDYNLLGRNITFGGFYQYNGEPSYGVNLLAPYLFSNRLGLAINYQDWSSREPYFYGQQATTYIYRNTSVEAFGLYEFNFKHNARLGVNVGSDRYDYQSGFLAPGVATAVKVNKVILKMMYEYNTLNFEYQYVSGIKNVFTLQQHFTDNTVQPDYLVGWNDILYFKRIGTKGNWANRLRTGLSTNSSSIFAPFTVDNNVNIRGVGNIIDRGTGSIVLNTEYRHTLYEKGWFVFQGNVFADVGSWRQPGGGLDDFFESNNGQLYTGLGFRLMHKRIFNAIFRLDYGHSFDNQSGGIVFGIGQYF